MQRRKDVTLFDHLVAGRQITLFLLLTKSTIQNQLMFGWIRA